MYNQIQLYMHGWAYSIHLIDSHSLFSIFHLPSVSPRKVVSSPTYENPKKCIQRKMLANAKITLAHEALGQKSRTSLQKVVPSSSELVS